MTFRRGEYQGGGWPKGIRRHPRGLPAADYIEAARDCGLSWRNIALLIRVDHRTVRRYISGEDYPRQSIMRRIRKRLTCYL